jgi:hypothetical protein
MAEKKIRKKIPHESKVRAELQKEIDSRCPFCDNDDVGHFEIHHIDENPENNLIGNLILLCPICHSKITKGDISQFAVSQKKIELLTKPKLAKQQQTVDKSVNFNAKIENAIVGSHNKITINQPKKKIVEKYPEGSIGRDINKKNHISHLITRYHEYKEYDVGKGQMNYATFPYSLKKEFKIGASGTIYNLSVERFDELAQHIQNRIDKTMLAKIKGKSHKNYSTFEEYAEEQTANK